MYMYMFNVSLTKLCNFFFSEDVIDKVNVAT